MPPHHPKKELPAMKTTRPSRLLLAVLLLALLLAALPFSAGASHSWGGYHWARTRNPFTLKVGDNVTADWDPMLNLAISDWSKSTVLDLTKVAGGTTSRCRPTAGRVEVCNSKYGANGWLGLAQIWLSGGHISQGTAKMNDTYFTMPAYNTTAERNHVMCQEVGHTFGLGHQDESGASLGTCMDYADDSTNSQHPNAHDYTMLEQIYSHLDSTNTPSLTGRPGEVVVDADMPADVATVELNTPSEWGQLVSSSPDGRVALYERDFGKGYKVLTAVYWIKGHIVGDHDH
jgi:hypothetical protein